MLRTGRLKALSLEDLDDAYQLGTHGAVELLPQRIESHIEFLPRGSRSHLEAQHTIVNACLLQVAPQHPQQRGELLEELAAEYRGEVPGGRAHGFLLRRAAGGWRFASVPEHADLVEQFIIGGATARLSQAALETLAVVAYRQPVTRGRVAQIRGVNVDGVMRTLHARGLIEEAGAETSGAILYRTTGDFLEYLGIDSLDELPPLAPYLPRVEALGEIVEQADEMAGRRTP